VNPFQRQRKKSGWGSGLAEWVNGNTAYISVVFSWKLQEAYQRACWYKAQGYTVRAGGPAVAFAPESMSSIAEIVGEVDALPRHNPNATFTTRGCPNRCKFCIVWRIEPQFVELKEWTPRQIVCDNNFLASSDAHFDRVIDGLKTVDGVDFNQGLDARLLTKRRASRLAELDLSVARLAWDNTKDEASVVDAFNLLRSVGVPARKIRIYVLIGFRDSPEDALYRLERVRELGSRTYPFPMRYQPPGAERKNSFVADSWTNRELKKFMRY
jgi:hypothetical protein